MDFQHQDAQVLAKRRPPPDPVAWTFPGPVWCSQLGRAVLPAIVEPSAEPIFFNSSPRRGWYHPKVISAAVPMAHRIRPQRHRLGEVGTIANPLGNDQLNLAMHAHFLQSLYRLRDGRQDRDPHVLDKGFLRRRRPTLHAIEHNHIRPSLHGQLDMVVRPAGVDFM